MVDCRARGADQVAVTERAPVNADQQRKQLAHRHDAYIRWVADTFGGFEPSMDPNDGRHWALNHDLMHLILGMFVERSREAAVSDHVWELRKFLAWRSGRCWVFIDWGYWRNEGPADMAYNLHFLTALRDMVRWCDLLGKTDEAAKYRTMQNKIEHVAEKWFDENLSQGKKGWQQIGYHSAVLGLRAGFFKGQKERDGIDYIKKHILRCFPNDPDAPRLGNPGMNNPGLITPYFAHYAFPLLIEHGEMDFVLNQYRASWGWALQQGSATWIEVFDTRWSQCHQWAGCPTWQLSRYVLGLRTRYDLGDHHFALSLFPGDLNFAEGKIPMPGEGKEIKIQWEKKSDGIHYEMQTPTMIYLSLDERLGEGKKTLQVDREFRHVFKNLR